MSGAEEPILARLARAVADGAAVDWEAEQARAGVPPELEMLRRLQALGALHLDDDATNAEGRRWGPLRILERIGAGAFGEVFRADDPSLRREVALKLWPVGDGELEERLLEARTLARVRHPNVLVVHGVDIQEGFVGMWTEILDGDTLEEWLESQGPLPAGEAMRVGIDLARALGAVHAEGLVHGDVKPANVVRETGGRIVLLDFGTVVDTATPSDGRLVGTPVTMAPERLLREAATVRTDIYGLGALLYRLLTAAYPIEATQLEVLIYKATRGELVPLRERRADLPPELVQIIETALAPDPAQRFATMRELERALSGALRAAGASPAGEDAPGPELDREAIPHHLPRPLTSFVGRSVEIATCVDTLRTVSLLTLTGSGGAGKSRLAIEVARRLLPEFSDGVWWVGLADVTAPERVVRELARMLQLREAGRTSLEDLVVAHLEDRRALVVLDNCEHMLDACRALIDRILRSAVGVRVLATSREPLALLQECVFSVPPLSLPPDAPTVSVERACGTEAVQLFEARARLADREFLVSALNVADVSGICRRLDGLPLAVELAAARIGVLTPRQIHERLGDALRLLRGPASALPRHQTLQAAIAWSFDLLAAGDRDRFCALSIFSGPFTLEAAHEIAGSGEDELETLDVLARLCGCSLLTSHRPDPAQAAYRMLETIRAYASSRLAAERLPVLRARHLEYFLRHAEAAEARHAAGAAEAFENLDRNQADVFAALDGGSVSPASADRGLRLAASLSRYWATRGQLSAGRVALERLLELAPALPSEPRDKALVGLGLLASMQSDLGEARRRFQQAHDDAAVVADSLNRARALTGLGVVEMEEERHDLARSYFERSLDLQLREAPGPGIATALNNLGAAAWRAGDWDGARGVLEDAVLRAEAAGVSDVAVMALTNLAMIDLCRPGASVGIERLERAIDQAFRLKVHGHAPGLLDLAGVAFARAGRHEPALVFFGASRAMRERMRRPADRIWQSTIEPHQRLARDALSPFRAVDCDEDGGRLEVSEALGRALEALRALPR